MLRGSDFTKLLSVFGNFRKKLYTIRFTSGDDCKALALVLLSDFLEWIDFGVYKASGNRYIRSLIEKE
jgi:hypothetical protein